MDPLENKETHESGLEWNKKIHLKENLILDVFLYIVLVI